MDNLCSVCNEKLTMFGGKLLKDGILCRNCAQLISPWITDEQLKRKSVKRILRHLQYREANNSRLAGFTANITVEGKYNLYIDNTKGLFVVSKRKDGLENNPDIVEARNIKSLAIVEEVINDEGAVDVYFEIKLKDCEMSSIKFRINEFPGIERGSQQHLQANTKANEYIQAFISSGCFGFNEMKFSRR